MGRLDLTGPVQREPHPPQPDAVQRFPVHPLLTTKLHMPRVRTQMVSRTHLIEQLQQGVQHQLTLISAPAGFGKTTLLAQWLSQSDIPVAWLSLEPEDNDPTRFLSYVIAALQTLDTQLGSAALELLCTPQPPPPETVLAVLVSELMECESGDMALVLDDYHAITAEALQRSMAFLLDHLPPQLHLILAARADPSLPLARLRAHGQLSETRAADLRFTSDEVRTFLQTAMKLELPPEAMMTLECRTEGWIAGLQMAALSLQGRIDIDGFLANFTGTHRFVLDYLSEEVLSQQASPVQVFLLHTSVLSRLSASLCDAVLRQEGSQEMLEALEKANLFVIALDEVRGWYRYHHLFAETLRSYLQQREPAMVAELHRRASDWYEQHAMPFEAVQHALAIPDEERAIRLIEPLVIPFAFCGQRTTVLRWLDALSETAVCAHPLLCAYYASLLLLTNQFEAAEARLREAERGLGEEMPVEQTRLIQGYMFTNRSTMAFFSGDLERAIPFAQRALDLLPETEDRARGGVLANIAHAYLVSGDTTLVSEQEVTKTVAMIRTMQNPFATVSGIALLARLQVLQGRLRQAQITYAQVTQVVSSPEVLQTLFTGPYYYFGLGDLLHEWNDLEAAERHLAQGMRLVNEELPLEAWVAILGYTSLAGLQQARGNIADARATLDALLQLAQVRHFAAPLLAQAAARRAGLELAQGNLAAATQWAETCELALNDADLPYLREYEYLTLARVYIAQAGQGQAAHSLQAVLNLLERLFREAEAKTRLSSVLEILVVRLLALEVLGDKTMALETLKLALQLAEPEGYIRLFISEREPMQQLLLRAQACGIIPDYVSVLLDALKGQQTLHLSPSSDSSDPLIEPLTEREREVLNLLFEGASNREIAQRLVLSVNTVKRHVYNLCNKLGVRSRTQVISRARLLKLV